MTAVFATSAGAWVDAAEAWFASLPLWLSFALLVASSFVASWVLAVGGLGLVRRTADRTDTWVDDLLLAELRAPLTVSIAAAGFYVAAEWLAFSPGDRFLLRTAALSVVLLVWARALVRLGDGAIEAMDEESAAMGFAPIFENLWTFLILVGTLFALLSFWKVDITPLLASAGIAGIAVGFAAKDTVANFFGSIALYVDNTYKVGDYVVLDSGDAGTVLDISIRSTRLLTRDNVVVTVPNSVLNSARIVNQSAPQPHKRVTVPVGVAYGSDVDQVEEILLAVADEEDLVEPHPEPRTRFRRFGDSALEYDLLCWVRTPLHDARAVHELNREIYRRFRAAGVEIPFPRREVTVRGSDAAGSEIVAESQRSD